MAMFSAFSSGIGFVFLLDRAYGGRRPNSMQMVCGKAQEGAAAGMNAARRSVGASEGGQPRRCWRTRPNRNR